ncbi:phage/plasmid replication protein, II/X family [Thiothrix fructosivorans]|uniref:Replication-associated protein G2P N-terminal domain-containing protein n=1 Tax=Thiothrix fructosivorans TaxID=111770 RepID=A0A8B0SFU6_9GAMM|nr:phage/plasmid replication protein, II/X family [Thiothrix fructosivorans]MBO0615132.1 hypothetical protein [Thiothrix fructosivorans]QTX09924.1 hypothetical protein J1836_015120 [Thiothrix fructosivorans]
MNILYNDTNKIFNNNLDANNLLKPIILKHLLGSKYQYLNATDAISPVMIDRIHCLVNIGEHTPIANSFLIELDEFGEVLRATNKSIKLNSEPDSKEQSMLIRSINNNTVIEVITSPNKYLYGHNLYGSSDISFLITETLTKALTQIERIDLLPLIQMSQIELHGVDINSMLTTTQVSHYLLSLPSRLNVNKIITPMPNTVYVGNYKKSDYAFRIYDKFVERKNKKLLAELQADEINYLEDKLRIELILHRRELQNLELINPTDWNINTAYKVYNDYRGKLKIMRDKSEDLSLLDHVERGIYFDWKYSGDPIELRIPNTKTRTKYRKSLKEKMGIDIYKPYVNESINPLLGMIEPYQLLQNGIPDTDAIVPASKLELLLQEQPLVRTTLLKDLLCAT